LYLLTLPIIARPAQGEGWLSYSIFLIKVNISLARGRGGGRSKKQEVARREAKIFFNGGNKREESFGG